jgi:amino acid adenylation domain-containing protein
MVETIESYALTSLQQGMLFNSLSTPNSGVEIEQIICTIKESLDQAVFLQAWEQIINRHPILRTRFEWAESTEPIQIVENFVSLKGEYFDWSHKNKQIQDTKFKEILDKDRLIDFPQNKAPLVRLVLFKFGKAYYKCIWTFHHSLLDGRSFPIILTEVFECYELLNENKSYQRDIPKPFSLYINWLAKKDYTKDELFWGQYLKGFTAPTPLPIARRNYLDNEIKENASEEITLSLEISSKLKSFAQQNRISLNTIIQGVWALLLYKYSGENDIVFGSTWSTRHSYIDRADSMVGLLINTLPVRVQISENQTIIPWLQQLRSQHNVIRNYLHTPLIKVQQLSDIAPGNLLFESLVVFENYYLNTLLRSQGGNWQNRTFHYQGQTSFPLTLAGYADNEIFLRIEYFKNHFEKDAIIRMLGHLRTLLSEIIINSNQSLGKIPYLTPPEKKTLVEDWNDTQSNYPQNSCIHSLFEEQVIKDSEAIALVFEGTELTYSELNTKSNQLANYLQSIGVGVETMVGLCVERSIEMVVATLGILKCGGAYVPLDPEYPQKRLEYMIKDTKTPILLIQNSLLDRFPSDLAKVVSIDSILNVLINLPIDCPTIESSANNLAYVMYTSGSTGQPKGIEITHRNVVRLVKNTNYASFDKDEVFLQYAPISFDASTLEIWGPLLNGGKLVICSPGQMDPKELGAIIKENKVTTVWLAAALFHNIVEYNIDCLSSVRQLLSGGDILSPNSVKKVIDKISDITLINGYGPTENTTFTCCYPMMKLSKMGSTVSIGRPISNTKVYILDRNLQPVPIGISGELYTSGDGVARGYLNQPELTLKSFIPNPFLKDLNSKVYKTGDLARYLPDGNIEFLGRIDRQVKLRGYRIELGEIESVLSKHSRISQVILLIREDRPGDKRLVAYFVPQEDLHEFTAELRSYLKDKLPEYMIPQHFVKMESFPITANGKIDRDALPSPTNVNTLSSKKIIEPRSDIERKMVNIWKEVLGTNNISIDDNFFEIGGHSILAVVVFSKIHRVFGINLPLATLFKTPTVEELTEIIEKKAKDIYRNDILPVGEDLEWRHLVAIQPNGKRPPLFCMHAVGGNVLNYHVFIPVLGEDQPIYGLQSRGVDGMSKQYSDIESMAVHYIKEIRKIKECGPYYLCGASMGGNIALEVAQQLKKDNEEISFLALFDTPGPGFLEPNESVIDNDFTLGKVRSFFNHHLPKLRKLSPKEQFSYLMNKIKFRISNKLKLIICGLFCFVNHPVPHKLRYWYVEQMNLKPAYKYKAKQYNGKITLFTDSTGSSKKEYNPTKGWEAVIKGEIEVIEIPANHNEFVEEPLLSEKLREYLLKAQNENVNN